MSTTSLLLLLVTFSCLAAWQGMATGARVKRSNFMGMNCTDLAIFLQNNTNMYLARAYAPVCNDDGSYGALQCMYSTCYCVDFEGNMINGTDFFQINENGDCECLREKSDYERKGLTGKTFLCNPNDGNRNQHDGNRNQHDGNRKQHHRNRNQHRRNRNQHRRNRKQHRRNRKHHHHHRGYNWL